MLAISMGDFKNYGPQLFAIIFKSAAGGDINYVESTFLWGLCLV